MPTKVARAIFLSAVIAGAPAASAEEPPDVLIKHGHWKRLRSVAQAMLKSDANSAEANHLMARAYLEWDDVGAAHQHAERAVKLNPRHPEYNWTLALVYGEQAERASMLRKIGLAKKFRNAVEAVLVLDPSHVEAHFGMMLYYFKAPGIVGGDKAKAHAEAAAIMRIDRGKGFQAKARLAQEEQQREKLPELYKQCVEANPKEYECHTALANLYANQNLRNPSAVESHAREAVKIAPDRTAGYSGLAWAMVAQRRWNDLDSVLTEAESRVPDDLTAFYTAASALYSDGQDYPRAERYLRKYLGQEREAGRPSHAAAHWRLGLVLERQGRKSEAIASMETAVRLDRSFEQAKKDLKRLKG